MPSARQTTAADAFAGVAKITMGKSVRAVPPSLLHRRLEALEASLQANGPLPTLSRQQLAEGAVVIDTSRTLAKALGSAPEEGFAAAVKYILRSQNSALGFRRVVGAFFEVGARPKLTNLYRDADVALARPLYGVVDKLSPNRRRSERTSLAEVKELTNTGILAAFAGFSWAPADEEALVVAAKTVVLRETLARTQNSLATTEEILDGFAVAHPDHPAVKRFEADGDKDQLLQSVVQLASEHSAKLEADANAARPPRQHYLSEPSRQLGS